LYYWFALQQWPFETPPVFSVPSGNFGNICAGMMAWASGLPVAHFIAACNVNDVVPRFLQSGSYEPRSATPTLSNAMDVGSPSNFVRIMELFLQNTSALKTMLSGDTVTDQTTKETIARIFGQYHYILDPHGAVGFKALEDYLATQPGQKGIFLETAHPVKFPDVVEEAIGQKLLVPEEVKPLFGKEKRSTMMEAEYTTFKEWLMGR
jgi:threonine synthase